MVAVQSRAELSSSKSSSSPLSLSPSKEGEEKKGLLSFAELLHGATLKKDEKEIQNGSFVLSLKEKVESREKPRSANKADNIQTKDIKERLTTPENSIKRAAPTHLPKVEKEIQNGTSALSLKEKIDESKNLQSSSKLNNMQTKDIKERPATEHRETKRDLSSQLPNKSEKKEPLLALLRGAEDSLSRVAERADVEMGAQLIQKFSPSELKQLIKDAKEYLKGQILQTEGFKRAEIDSLPKTLKGLMQVAQKFGIELSKITVQEVQKSPSVTPKEQKSVAQTKEQAVPKEETAPKEQKSVAQTKEQAVPKEETAKECRTDKRGSSTKRAKECRTDKRGSDAKRAKECRTDKRGSSAKRADST